MSKKSKNIRFWESAILNNVTAHQYFERLMELAVSRFKWSGFPKSVDTRFLEVGEFENGHMLFFKDDVINEFLCLRVALGAPFTVYNIPKTRQAYAVNGYRNSLNDKNSVIIYNNMAHTLTKDNVMMYAYRLYNLDRIIDVNANAQKTPILVQVEDEKERLTLKNLFSQYDGNEPVIYADKSMTVKKPLTYLSANVPYIADKIQTLKSEIWNEALTYLGVSNVNLVKKERLVRDEVQRNMGGVLASRQSALMARQQAAEEINEMFGLNVTVEWNDELGESEEDGLDISDEAVRKEVI